MNVSYQHVARAVGPFALAIAVIGGASAAWAQGRGTGSGELSAGPHATMSMKLERTVFDIDVVRVQLRVDEPTRRRLAQLVRGERYSDERAQHIAAAILDADRARTSVTFLRDVDLEQFLEETREDLGRAVSAGMLEADVYERIVRGLPQWFAAIEQRGFREGDRLYYDIHPSSLTTQLVDEDGQVVEQRVMRGEEFPRAVLAGYLAPGSTFRSGLIRSLF